MEHRKQRTSFLTQFDHDTIEFYIKIAAKVYYNCVLLQTYD